MEKIKRNVGINGAFLKICAIINMLTDHIGGGILERALYGAHPLTGSMYKNILSVDNVLRNIGRLAFPIFIFLLIEGFHYTHSKLQYTLRMFIFAFISEIPFDLAFNKSWFYPQSNNVFFTLVIGFLTVWALDELQDHITQDHIYELFGLFMADTFIIYFGMSLALFLFTDYDAGGVAAIVIMYIYRNWGKYTRASSLFLGISSGILTILASAIEGPKWLFPLEALIILLIPIAMTIFSKKVNFSWRMLNITGMAMTVITLSMTNGIIELWALFNILLIFFYNGKRGRQIKYFFYAFYPVHLLIIAIIANAMGLKW